MIGLSKVQNKEITVWLAINSNFTIRMFDAPQKRLRNIYWIKKEDSGQRYTTSYENTFSIYYYEIYDKKLNPIEIEFNGWKLKRIQDPLEKHSQNHPKATFANPFGELRIYQVNDFNEFGCVKTALEKLEEIGIYNDWQSYDLKSTNENLKEEIEQLKSENNTLYSKVHSFKNTDLYKKIEKCYNDINNKGLSEGQTQSFMKKNNLDENFISTWLETENNN